MMNELSKDEENLSNKTIEHCYESYKTIIEQNLEYSFDLTANIFQLETRDIN